MDAPPPPDWAQLPFPLVAQLVRTLAALPPHCGLRQLLEVCRDWRSAVSDALESWTAPPAVLAGSTTAADAPLPLLLRRFRHLRHLTLDFAELAEEGEAPTLGAPALLALSSLRRLECLHLAGCRPSQALFRAVAALPSLRSLAFTPGDGGDALVPRDASPAPLAGATALTSLALASFPLGHDISADVVQILRSCFRLRHLSLYRSVRATPAQAQAAFDIGFATQLTSLGLRCTFSCDDALARLCTQLTNLRRLDLSGSRNLSDDGFLAVTALAGSLTQLALQGGHQVSEDGATALAALTRLRALDLGFSNAMGDDALLPLVARALTQLTLLDLRGCPHACSPAAFTHLSRITSLQHLSAQGCRLQPSSVAALAPLACLSRLDLADNPALGPLDALTTLRELRALDVSECGVSDAHLLPLLSHLPQLRTALLGSNHRLTVAVVEALAAGPARTCLQELSVTGLELDGPALERVLPLLAALQRLDVSAAACLGGDVGDAEALLAAAQAAPSLHTLTARGLTPVPQQEWQELAQAAAARRPLLRIVC
ncbi:receptor-type [Micractinium conductrix]|uniref:Receptor-type n=1 Tax=Micractinium conductrix TaxID=554055 RepID=A0A2P6VNB3_9CHLO|nr:receptor-type [Micractinium conductrix]|eukprot:PSC75547.1 receptor-type [Micractinium conductrix]